MQKELWLAVKGFEGLYEVSDLGRVRSLDRTTKTRGDGKRISKGRVLKFKTDKYGYYCVCLRKNLKNHHKTVHRLIAEVFVENKENKPQVNHIDGNKLNNHYSNLEWCTTQENTEHAKVNGLICSGTRCHKAKLNWNIVNEIRRNYEGTKTYKDLGIEYGVSPQTIRSLILGKTWKM